MRVKAERSALNELEATSCLLSAVLLPLFDPRVPRHVAAGSEFLLKGVVHLDERSGNSEPDRASLAGDTAALDGRLDVESSEHSNVNERAVHENLENGSAKVFLEFATINGDLSFTGGDPDTSDRALASAGAVILLRSCHRVSYFSFLTLSGWGF